jgi:2-oxoglutarate ferredoxin oxidoreductase subunit beta
MKSVYTKPESLTDKDFHFCPGCHHGIIHKLVAEAIDYYDLREKTIGVASVGCSVFLYDYFNVDVVEAPHGRAAAVATGVKRVKDDGFVFTYQGDGDLAAIGTAEIIHAANRGEMITVIFVNNAIYGMTGGQMAPTTLLGQKSTTSPFGRDFQRDGYPIKMAEMLATLEGVCFSGRFAVDKISNLRKAKKAILKAFEMQIKGIGFSFVEILSSCPTNWGLSPIEANKRIEDEMIPYYPLGIFKEKTTKDEL